MKQNQFTEIAVPLARQKKSARRERMASRTSGQRCCQLSKPTRKPVVQTNRCARISDAEIVMNSFQYPGMIPQVPNAAMPATSPERSSLGTEAEFRLADMGTIVEALVPSA